MLLIDFAFAATFAYILFFGVQARGIDEYFFMWVGIMTLPLRLMIWDIRRLKGDIP